MGGSGGREGCGSLAPEADECTDTVHALVGKGMCGERKANNKRLAYIVKCCMPLTLKLGAIIL